MAIFGEAYNLSGVKAYAIQEIVGILTGLVGFDFAVWEDPALLRPTDEAIMFGDSGRFQRATGWRQEIRLRQTLGDMLDYWKRVL